MINVFEEIETDGKYARHFIREANIKLASLSESVLTERLKDIYYITLCLIRDIEPYKLNIKSIVDTFNIAMDKGLLSPLTLNDNEFEKEESSPYLSNIRYPTIVKLKDTIYNSNAYKITIRAAYDGNNNIQIPIYTTIPNDLSHNPTIFISKGGIITGEFINECIIRKEIVDKHSFTIQSVVNIPVSAILYNDAIYYVVDHREPKLKALKEFYDVPINFDEKVKELKLNIRKYKKL